MRNRISPKIILHAGWYFLKNEFLKQISLLSNKNFCHPLNLIDIKLTLRCNLRCQQCSMWAWPSMNELSTETWGKIILDIKSFLGPYLIRFDGGEPFCREDFLELIEFCSKNDIFSLITTNGTLIDESIAKELLKNKIAIIQISLDGFKPQTHDSLRGVEGTYQKALRAIELLKGNMPIQINTTIMDQNLDEILDLTDFAHRNRIQISFQGLLNLKLRDIRRIFEPDDYLSPKDLKKLDRVIEELCKKKKYNRYITNSYTQLMRLKHYYHHSNELRKKCCEIIYNHQLWIKYNGDVFPCRFIGPIGNLTKNSIRDIWHSKEADNKIQEMKKCNNTKCLILRGYHKESYSQIITKITRCLLR